MAGYTGQHAQQPSRSASATAEQARSSRRGQPEGGLRRTDSTASSDTSERSELGARRGSRATAGSRANSGSSMGAEDIETRLATGGLSSGGLATAVLRSVRCLPDPSPPGLPLVPGSGRQASSVSEQPARDRPGATNAETAQRPKAAAVQPAAPRAPMRSRLHSTASSGSGGSGSAALDILAQLHQPATQAQMAYAQEPLQVQQQLQLQQLQHQQQQRRQQQTQQQQQPPQPGLPALSLVLTRSQPAALLPASSVQQLPHSLQVLPEGHARLLEQAATPIMRLPPAATDSSSMTGTQTGSSRDTEPSPEVTGASAAAVWPKTLSDNFDLLAMLCCMHRAVWRLIDTTGACTGDQHPGQPYRPCAAAGAGLQHGPGSPGAAQQRPAGAGRPAHAALGGASARQRCAQQYRQRQRAPHRRACKEQRGHRHVLASPQPPAGRGMACGAPIRHQPAWS